MYHHLVHLPISLFISLAALAGVTVHDTKVDKLATSLVGVPAVIASTDAGHKSFQSDLHTHVERVTLNEMNSGSPRVAPRSEKRYILQKNSLKGKNGFEGYIVPLQA